MELRFIGFLRLVSPLTTSENRHIRWVSGSDIQKLPSSRQIKRKVRRKVPGYPDKSSVGSLYPWLMDIRDPLVTSFYTGKDSRREKRTSA